MSSRLKAEFNQGLLYLYGIKTELQKGDFAYITFFPENGTSFVSEFKVIAKELVSGRATFRENTYSSGCESNVMLSNNGENVKHLTKKTLKSIEIKESINGMDYA